MSEAVEFTVGEHIGWRYCTSCGRPSEYTSESPGPCPHCGAAEPPPCGTFTITAVNHVDGVLKCDWAKD